MGVNFPDVYRICCNIFKQRGFSYETLRGRTQWREIAFLFLVEGGKETWEKNCPPFPFSPHLLVAKKIFENSRWDFTVEAWNYFKTLQNPSIKNGIIQLVQQDPSELDGIFYTSIQVIFHISIWETAYRQGLGQGGLFKKTAGELIKSCVCHRLLYRPITFPQYQRSR